MREVDLSPDIDILPEMRVTARKMVSASRNTTNEEMLDLSVDIARLGLVDNPNEIDRESSDYKYGIYEAFSSIQGSFLDGVLPGPEVAVGLEQPNNALVLTKFAAKDGQGLRSIAKDIDVRPLAIKNSIRQLGRIGLIEPAIPHDELDRKAWQLSPGGEHIFKSFLFDYLPKLVTEEDLLEGIAGIIHRSSKVK